MITAVDTNVLLDLLAEDPSFEASSEKALRGASREGALVVCEVVYAEVAGFFSDKSDLDLFLEETGVQLKPSSSETLWRTGELWRKFCLKQSHPPGRTRRLIADFLIGAHALLQADRFLTRDKGFYHRAFTGLRLASPLR